MLRRVAIVLVGLCSTCLAAGTPEYQLVVAQAPQGSHPNQADWRPVSRFDFFAGTLPIPVPRADLPVTEVFDPSGAAFRTATDLFISNRHGNVTGAGSISRFTLNPDGSATLIQNITASGMIGVHQIAFNAAGTEMFACTINNGVYRFSFDESGVVTPRGSFGSPLASRGIAVHPNGRVVFVSDATTTVKRFRLENDGSVTSLGSILIPGSALNHNMKITPDRRELYIFDITGRVHRLRFNGEDNLTHLSQFMSPGCIDGAFSPNGRELFIANHTSGGITRYLYNAETNSWGAVAGPNGTIAMPFVGGIGTHTPVICLADLDDGSGAGVPDAAVTIDDLLYMLGVFNAGTLQADLDDGSGTGTRDGAVTIDDLLFFLDRFGAGC
ncbi:MAG: hypothetical protein IPK69_05100 [Phycisphaerales bacterium]|nr:MAG: hypothetical protein IPK69_05100 [Phycisphaerales bacterium]